MDAIENNYHYEEEKSRSKAEKKPEPKSSPSKKKYPTKGKTGSGGKDEIIITPDLIKMMTKEEVKQTFEAKWEIIACLLFVGKFWDFMI